MYFYVEPATEQGFININVHANQNVNYKKMFTHKKQYFMQFKMSCTSINK